MAHKNTLKIKFLVGVDMFQVTVIVSSRQGYMNSISTCKMVWLTPFPEKPYIFFTHVISANVFKHCKQHYLFIYLSKSIYLSIYLSTYQSFYLSIYLVLSCLIVSYLLVSYLILSDLIWSYLILSYRILSYLILSIYLSIFLATDLSIHTCIIVEKVVYNNVHTQTS